MICYNTQFTCNILELNRLPLAINKLYKNIKLRYIYVMLYILSSVCLILLLAIILLPKSINNRDNVSISNEFNFTKYKNGELSTRGVYDKSKWM